MRQIMFAEDGKMRVYDCFTFFNEFDLLEWRLRMLWDVVDCFVIVEAGYTFQGKRKPFYLEENRERFAPYWSKIRLIHVTDEPENPGQWGREIYQRNCIVRGLQDAAADDIILVGDVDEIPDPRALQYLLHNQGRVNVFSPFGHVSERAGMRGLSRNLRCALSVRRAWGQKDKPWDFLRKSPVVLEQRMFEFFVNRECPFHWCGTILAMRQHVQMPQDLRKLRNKLPMMLSGWHFSSMGGLEAVKKKFLATSDGTGMKGLLQHSPKLIFMVVVKNIRDDGCADLRDALAERCRDLMKIWRSDSMLVLSEQMARKKHIIQ